MRGLGLDLAVHICVSSVSHYLGIVNFACIGEGGDISFSISLATKGTKSGSVVCFTDTVSPWPSIFTDEQVPHQRIASCRRVDFDLEQNRTRRTFWAAISHQQISLSLPTGHTPSGEPRSVAYRHDVSACDGATTGNWRVTDPRTHSEDGGNRRHIPHWSFSFHATATSTTSLPSTPLPPLAICAPVPCRTSGKEMSVWNARDVGGYVVGV